LILFSINELDHEKKPREIAHQNLVVLYTCLSGQSWSWSYGSWIYNYQCHQRLSPLNVWYRTAFMVRCTQYNIMW